MTALQLRNYLIRLLAACFCVLFQQSLTASLSIDADGQVFLHGKPFRGVGINYYDIFLNELDGGNDGSRRPACAEGFQYLASRGIPFVRFTACGYYPEQIAVFIDDRKRHFAIMDAIVAEAESAGIGLVPSLFWHVPAVPELMGESLQAWGDPASKTRHFLREYAEAMVSRYRDSPAIWGWEFGNEYWLHADHSQEDKAPHALSGEDVLSAYAAFAAVVRELDAERPIFTGDAQPRSCAWNLRQSKGWKQDSPEQWLELLSLANPPVYDTISLHVYPAHLDGPRKGCGYGLPGGSFEDTLAAASQLASEKGQALWLGEFGVSKDAWDAEVREQQLRRFLASIEALEIPLSAYWVFDSPNPDLEVWNAVPGGSNDFVFDLLEATNRRLCEATGNQ